MKKAKGLSLWPGFFCLRCAETAWSHCMIAVVFIAYDAFIAIVILWIICLFFFHPMMAVMFLSQHLVSRIDRSQCLFGACCVEHAEMMCSEVCLCAPHLQLQEEAKPYLYKDDQKRLSQTLFGNPKGPVELGNPNTCTETKLCLNFILFRLKK